MDKDYNLREKVEDIYSLARLFLNEGIRKEEIFLEVKGENIELPIKTLFQKQESPKHNKVDVERELGLIMDKIEPEDIVFDCGAHIGFFSALISRTAKHVYSFEVEPEKLDFFEDLMDYNDIENVTLVRKAVGGENKNVVFQRSSSYDSLKKGKYFECGQITLEGFIEKRSIIPDLIKIDIEGMEEKVIPNSENLLEKYRPKLWIEVHSNVIGPDVTQELIEILNRYYTLNYYQRGKEVSRDQTDGRFHIYCMPNHEI